MRFLSIHLAAPALAMVVCLAYPATMHAQTRTPLRGWFGSGRTGPGEAQTLSLTGRLFETFDSTQDSANPDLQAGIRYDRKTRNQTLYATADTSARRFDEFGGLSSISHEASAGFSTSLGRRTRVQLDQYFRTSPFYLVTLVPREIVEDPTEAIAPPESASDYALFRRKTTSWTTGAAVSHLLARHSSLNFTYAVEQQHTTDTDFRSHYLKASFSQYLGRYAVARAGYARRLIDRQALSATNALQAASHDVDLGIDYNRPLSISRKTTMLISTGSAFVPVQGGAHQYRFLGAASLNREMGRTWRAALSYGRNLEFVETFSEPLLSDTASMRIDGSFTRRLHLAVSAGLTKGSVGFASGDLANHYDTYSGSAQLRWSVHRLVTAYGEYAAYGQAFGSDVQLPIGFGGDVKRSEIRVGLTVWAPLIR